MPNFIPYNHNQDTMVVINFLDQLQPGTFEHAIHYLVENCLASITLSGLATIMMAG